MKVYRRKPRKLDTVYVEPFTGSPEQCERLGVVLEYDGFWIRKPTISMSIEPGSLILYEYPPRENGEWSIVSGHNPLRDYDEVTGEFTQQ